MAAVTSAVSASSEQPLVTDLFRLHKLVVLADRHGTVYGLDSRNGELLYRRAATGTTLYTAARLHLLQPATHGDAVVALILQLPGVVRPANRFLFPLLPLPSPRHVPCTPTLVCPPPAPPYLTVDGSARMEHFEGLKGVELAAPELLPSFVTSANLPVQDGTTTVLAVMTSTSE